MALATQIIPCGAQSLGGGYTEVNLGSWGYKGSSSPRPRSQAIVIW